MQFNILLQSLSVTAALLPSLQAQYKMDHVSSAGVSGNKAKFTIDLPNHSLSFTTKVHASEANTLPSEACIALPEIHVSAEYIPENAPQVSLTFTLAVTRVLTFNSARTFQSTVWFYDKAAMFQRQLKSVILNDV